ncbi:hypothetical protein RIF29_42136 [Crotalaria pallida]|uniref:AIG1-type G domain-containing protein n=1 Tax=Crotalaria pallida TaxID=3830 RepID=A0AAN9E8L0_CROPI
MDSHSPLHVSHQSPDTTSTNDNNLVNGVNGSEDVGEEYEDFDTEPSKPILVPPHANSPKSQGFVDDPSLSSAEILSPNSQMPIAKVTLDDNEEEEEEDDDDDDDDAVSAEEEQGGGGGDDEKGREEEEEEEEVFVEASGDDKGFDAADSEGVVAVENGVELNDDSKKDEEVVNEEKGEESNELLHDSQKGDDSADNNTLSGETGDVVVNKNDGDDVVDKNDGDVVVDKNDGDIDDKSDDVVKFNSDGDSIVESVQANVLESGGVAVVGDKAEQVVEQSDIKGLEAPASGVSLDNVFDSIQSEGAEDVLDIDNKVEDGDAESSQIVGSGVDDGKESDIAPLVKDESVKAVQDDVNIEGHADEGETGTHTVEPGIEGLEALTRGVGLDNGQKSDIAPVESGHDGQKSDIAPVEGHAVQDDINVEADADEEEIENHIEASGKVDEEERGGNADDREIDGSVLDREGESLDFGSSDAPKNYLEELEEEEQQGVGEISRDQRIDGQIVTDSDEEADTDDDDGDDKELFDSATLAALLKAASGTGQDGGNITITSQDGSRLFSVERPAGLGPSLQPGKPAMRPNRANLFAPSISRPGADPNIQLSKEEKEKLEKLQQIRIKFLRLVQRLGFTTEESIAAQVLYRLTLVAGRPIGQLFNLDAAKESASQLEAEGRDDLDYSITILVLGKTGVGKSATINSIFGETKTNFSAYGPATTAVTEIVGMVDGVKIRVFDTPGLKSSALEQSANRKVLSAIKKVTKKSPPDIVLYVDRLDLQTRDLNDLPLLKSITSALGPSIWRNVIVTLTHGASAPPDGPSGNPLTYDVFVAQRSHIVQQTIGQAVGDLRLMNPNLMNPVSLVENHPSCRKNRDGQKVLPNGQTWRPLLLLLCFSMKILSEAGNVSKAPESFDHRRLFGFRTRSPPLPYLLSWLLQSRTHPKLASDQGGVDNGDSDVDMADLSDSDLDEEEDEYDQLPPFKPLRKAQIAKLSREQHKAYLEEYDYRVKLLQKKQWRDELRRMREVKKKGKTNANDYGYPEDDDQENGAPAAVPVPLPDMALPPSFDSDNPAYRYRFLEPNSQLLTRPVLDTHSWDHDCGYDGVNLEQALAIINKFPAAVTVQITKDKKDFNLHLDSSVAAKHGENGSTMAGFDIQNIGKQLAYIVRGETKFKNYKRNKTAAGFSVTFLGENVSTGLKVEDQIALGKRLVLVGSTGTVRCQGDSVYGANVEVRLREADFPIGQDQSSLSLSLVKWRGDLAVGANFQSQISFGRSYKMGVRAGLNNKLSGQVSVRTSSSDQLQIALIAILPVARAIYKNFFPGASENYSIY